MADDRQISSEDQRSVKLRVRSPPTGTHQCHRVTSVDSPQGIAISSELEPNMLGIDLGCLPAT